MDYGQKGFTLIELLVVYRYPGRLGSGSDAHLLPLLRSRRARGQRFRALVGSECHGRNDGGQFARIRKSITTSWDEYLRKTAQGSGRRGLG